MDILEIEPKETLSREEAAARLEVTNRLLRSIELGSGEGGEFGTWA
jgi:hypothetical protein